MLFKMKLPRGDRGGAAAQGQAVARGTATKEGGGKGPPIPPRWTFASQAERSARAGWCARGQARLAAGRGPLRPAGKTGTPLRRNGRHSFGPPARLATGSTPPGLPAVVFQSLKDRIDACRSMPLT
jgi:hypothetical protein